MLAFTMLGLVAGVQAEQDAGFLTSVPAYAVSLTPDYVVEPLISVGDRVPLASDSTREFQLIGVPDGIGTYRKSEDETVIFLNHEVAGTALSEPVVGNPRFRGAFVSRFTLNRAAEVMSGEPAYNVIIDGETGLCGQPARADNTERAFWRFCSGTLAWKDAGFDQPIYLCGEENAAPNTFDGRGGLAVAIFDHQLRTLPHLGRFQHENLPVRPHPSRETVMVLLEDNGTGFDSQLYLYVGTKRDAHAGGDPLVRNGLIGGKFYTFVPTTPGSVDESQFVSGTITGTWVELTGVANLTETQLETAADAVGAFGMTKAEDGAWSKKNKNEFFFNTTGDGGNNLSAPGNHLGRTYRLNLDPRDLTGPCRLSILYNADQIVQAGGDIALTPDNMDTSKDFLMVCEDGTGFSRNVMAAKNRQSQIWRYDLNHGYAAEPVVSLVTSGRDGVAVAPGVWESSGVVNVEKSFGRDAWLFDVQAHPPTAAPVANTVEDGQLLLLRPSHHQSGECERD